MKALDHMEMLLRSICFSIVYTSDHALAGYENLPFNERAGKGTWMISQENFYWVNRKSKKKHVCLRHSQKMVRKKAVNTINCRVWYQQTCDTKSIFVSAAKQ